MDDGAKVKTEYEQLIQRYVDAVNKGDAEAVTELFADDAVILEPGLPAVIGRQAILEVYRDWLGDGVPVNVEIRDVQDGGSVLYGTGTFDAGNGPGNWLQVLMRQPDGRLRIHRICSNRI